MIRYGLFNILKQLLRRFNGKQIVEIFFFYWIANMFTPYLTSSCCTWFLFLFYNVSFYSKTTQVFRSSDSLIKKNVTLLTYSGAYAKCSDGTYDFLIVANADENRSKRIMMILLVYKEKMFNDDLIIYFRQITTGKHFLKTWAILLSSNKFAVVKVFAWHL